MSASAIEVRASRDARRLVDQRFGGRLYVWRGLNGLVAASDELRAPPGTAFWRSDADDLVVFVSDEIALGAGGAIVLEKRRGELTASWTTLPSTGGLGWVVEVIAMAAVTT